MLKPMNSTNIFVMTVSIVMLHFETMIQTFSGLSTGITGRLMITITRGISKA